MWERLKGEEVEVEEKEKQRECFFGLRRVVFIFLLQNWGEREI